MKRIHVGGITTVRICSEEKSILSRFGYNFERDILSIYTSFSLWNIKFTSLKAKEVSTVYYFIELDTREIGAVHFYFVSNDIAYALVQQCGERNWSVVRNCSRFPKPFRKNISQLPCKNNNKLRNKQEASIRQKKHVCRWEKI